MFNKSKKLRFPQVWFWGGERELCTHVHCNICRCHAGNVPPNVVRFRRPVCSDYKNFWSVSVLSPWSMTSAAVDPQRIFSQALGDLFEGPSLLNEYYPEKEKKYNIIMIIRNKSLFSWCSKRQDWPTGKWWIILAEVLQVFGFVPSSGYSTILEETVFVSIDV